ncbi:MAG TPA: pilus assembly protein TadG-related protein [Terriglobales bacterium]|nr:pilus assembly protein TadG-related protein [Terriglobales bacterium]
MTNIRRHSERGFSVPMVAIFLFVLLAMAALAIDMGMLYTARNSAQSAADAAALAGAFTFMNPAAAQPDNATIAAINAAAANGVLGQSVVITAADVNVDTANRRVTVTVPRTGDQGVSTYFARALGTSKADVIAQATAECSTVGTGSRCLKPIYIPNTILSALAPASACSSGQVLFDSSHSLTSWGQAQMGQLRNIRPSNPQNALLPSQFYSLDFGSGADTYRCSLGQCLTDCDIDTTVVRCGESYPLKTGNMVGPTRQGVGDLTGPTPDAWVASGQYRQEDGNLYDTSRQLVIAPVWDNCTQSVSPGYHGQQVQVIGFVQLFIDGMSGSNVQAHFVSPIACAEGGAGEAGNTGANTGPYGVPIRLVQAPSGNQ